MRTNTIGFRYSRLTFCSWLSSIISLIVGALVLIGWLLDISVLKSVVPDLVTMKVNTAICFMLAGVALWLLQAKSLTPKRRNLALISAGLVFLIGLLTMLEYVLPGSFGIDELWWKQPAEALVSSAPGRMSFVTALTFFLLGSALMLLSQDKWRGVAGAQIIAFVTAIIPFIGLIGYIYNVQSLYQISAYSSMALHTAVTAELCCFGILLARPDQQLIGSITSPNSGGVMARRLMPFVILVPIIIGWLRLAGQNAGYYDTIFGVVLLVISFIISFLIILWVQAHKLNQLDTSRAETEKSLRESEERLRLATEATQMGTWDLDLISSKLYWSPGMERLMGFAPGSFPGTYEDFANLIHPEDRERFAAAQQHALRNKGHYQAELRFILPDGRTRWGLGCGQMIFDERGVPMRIVGVDLDITDRRQVEESLRQSEHHFRALFEGAGVGNVECDAATGRFLHINQKMCEIAGYSAEELLTLNFRDITHPVDREQNFDNYQRFITGELPTYSVEKRYVRKDGSIVWVQVTSKLLCDVTGQPWRTVAVVQDITERKRVEEEVQQLNADLEKRVVLRTEELAAANREMEAFSYSVSHDLRAPLRAIDGFARILVDEYAPQLPPAAFDYLQIVRDNTQQMGKLIDDLLNFARLNRQSCRKLLIAPEPIVHQVLAQLQPELTERRVEISVGEMPDCWADQALLKQVFVNLLSNALKFTSRCEVAIISVGCLQAAHPAAAPIYFVKDNGVGFNMKYAHKLFNVFQRLHRAEDYEGTGVGLATVQRIIQRHGGRIWAEAALNQGATFFFTLAGEISA